MEQVNQYPVAVFPRCAFSVMRTAESVAILASAARRCRDAEVAKQEDIEHSRHAAPSPNF